MQAGMETPEAAGLAPASACAAPGLPCRFAPSTSQRRLAKVRGQADLQAAVQTWASALRARQSSPAALQRERQQCGPTSGGTTPRNISDGTRRAPWCRNAGADIRDTVYTAQTLQSRPPRYEGGCDPQCASLSSKGHCRIASCSPLWRSWRRAYPKYPQARPRRTFRSPPSPSSSPRRWSLPLRRILSATWRSLLAWPLRSSDGLQSQKVA
mmetsp:Transcript_40206/g.87888  ORF Transcript_40206/g.87888 Transcript_40206/m.87888 type:complete len:211 (-) Transcript_40206:156-788(-)